MPAPRVVVVDDSADLRALLRRVLGRGGFEVVGEAGDGRAGIEVAREQRPDVILLDLAMPVMDGLEALPTLRAACPDATIIVLSGVGAAQTVRRAMTAGADGYLQKGVSNDAILRYVRDVTAGAAPPLAPEPAASGPAPDAPPGPHAPPEPPGQGVLELLDEPIYRVVAANPAAEELLGRPCRPGTPLFAATPALASTIALHRSDAEPVFEATLSGRRLTVTLRRTPGRLTVHLLPQPR